MLGNLSFRNLVLAPLWAAQLASGTKCFDTNPFIGSRKLNVRGLHGTRVRVAASLTARRRRRLADKLPKAWLNQFEQDGFIEIRDALPSATFEELRRQVLAFEAPRRDMKQGNAITRRMAVNSQMLGEIPSLSAFLQDPRISAAMRYVASFDSEPLHYVQAIIKNASGREDPQTALHSDTFHSSMKAWFFLEDVAAGSGAFTYVRGSHRPTCQRLQWEQEIADKICAGGGDRLSRRGSFRIEAQELDALGLPQPTELAVSANTLVIADTFGFHARGKSTRASNRIEIWSYLRRNPFLPWTGLDFLSSRFLVHKRVDALWKFRDRFKGTLGQPWRPTGVGRILDDQK